MTFGNSLKTAIGKAQFLYAATRWETGVCEITVLYAYSRQIGNPRDASRLNGLKFFFDNFMAFLLPNGIVNDASNWNFSIWGGQRRPSNANLARDSVFAYVIQFLGFGLAILAGVLCATSASMSLLRSPKLVDAIRSLFLLLAFCLLFVVDGLVLTQFERSFQYGVAFALCFPAFKRRMLW